MKMQCGLARATMRQNQAWFENAATDAIERARLLLGFADTPAIHLVQPATASTSERNGSPTLTIRTRWVLRVLAASLRPL